MAKNLGFVVYGNLGHIAQKSGCSLKNVTKISQCFSLEKYFRYDNFSNPLSEILLLVDKNLNLLTNLSG